MYQGRIAVAGGPITARSHGGMPQPHFSAPAVQPFKAHQETSPPYKAQQGSTLRFGLVADIYHVLEWRLHDDSNKVKTSRRHFSIRCFRELGLGLLQGEAMDTATVASRVGPKVNHGKRASSAIVMACAVWGSNWKGQCILAKCDMAAVAGVNARMSLHSDMMYLLRCLFTSS